MSALKYKKKLTEKGNKMYKVIPRFLIKMSSVTTPNKQENRTSKIQQAVMQIVHF